MARTFLEYTKVVAKPIPGMPVALNTIGDHIRKVRIEKGLTQKEAAEIIDVDEDSIINWEMRGTEPAVHNYPAIIKFLGYYPFETETLGDTLLMSRRLHGLSAMELGKWLGVNGSTIRSYEQNKTVPSETMLMVYYEFSIERTKPL